MASELLDGHFIGTVLKINKDTRQVGVYIPKLMSTMYEGEATDYKYPTNSGLNITNITTNIATTVNKTNYLWVNARDKNEPMPEIGSKVMIRFLDNSPKYGYWETWNYNGDYQVIEEERYPEYFKLKSGERTITVNDSDEITLKFPDTYRITSSENGKSKELALHEDFKFYKQGTIEESINALQKSMQYIETTYYNTFIKNIGLLNIEPVAGAMFNTVPSFTMPTASDDLETYKTNAATALDNFITNNFGYYSLKDTQMIQEQVRETKDALGNAGIIAGVDTILNSFIKFIQPYNKSVNTFITEYFDKNKEMAFKLIKATNNLLDADHQYNYMNELLIGLKDTYNMYTTYKTAYNTAINATEGLAATLENSYKINAQLIDTNIRIAFSKAFDSTDYVNVSKYVKYIKTLFPTTATVTYKFSTNGYDYQYLDKDTSKIFAKFDPTTDFIVSGDVEDKTGEEIAVEDLNMVSREYNSGANTLDIYPVMPGMSVAPIIASKFDVVGWEDSDHVALSNNYYLIKNEMVTPKFIGLYLTYNDNTDEELLHVRDDSNIGYSLTYTVNGTTTAKTVAQINQMIADGNLLGNVKFTLTYNTNKVLELNLDNDTVETVEDIISFINDLNNRIDTTDYHNILEYEERFAQIDRLIGLVPTAKSDVSVSSDYDTAKSTYDTLYGYYIKASIIEPLQNILSIFNIGDTADDIELGSFVVLDTKYQSLTQDQLANLPSGCELDSTKLAAIRALVS